MTAGPQAVNDPIEQSIGISHCVEDLVEHNNVGLGEVYSESVPDLEPYVVAGKLTSRVDGRRCEVDTHVLAESA
jgi:hypothetical protein